MATEITTINTALYEITGAPGPRVQHEIASFEILSTLCRVRLSPESDLMLLRVGHREFALSVLDLAATAALAVEGQLKAEIKGRVLANRQPVPIADTLIPVRGTVEPDGSVSLGRRGL